MIDVKTTILETIKDKIDRMRLLGENQSCILKRVMYLIILDDIYDWSNYLEQPLSVQHKLQELRVLFILNNPEFIIKMFPNNNFYVNVNTPQNNDTWKRVWDAPDVLEISERFQPYVPGDSHAEPFIPDNTCPVSITYFGEGENIPADNQGKPIVDFKSLTICEKMNIYINRTTGQMFFLDPATCTWQVLKGDFASAVKWGSIVDAPKIYSQIEHKITNSDKLNVTLDEATQDAEGNWQYGSQSSDVPVTNINDLDDVL